MAKPLFSCPEEFKFLAEDYFRKCDEAGIDLKYGFSRLPYTLPGLAKHLGLSTTKQFNKYREGEGFEEYHEIAQHAALTVEDFTVRQCYHRGVNVSGPIFMLKNMGYTDRPEGGHHDTLTVKIEGVNAKL